MKANINELKEQLLEVTYLERANALLEWDQNVNLSSGGHEARARMMGSIVGQAHEKFISKQFEELLMAGLELARSNKLSEDDTSNVFKTGDDFTRAKKLPTEFVAEVARLCGEAYEVWTKAKSKSDFKLFEPYLVRIVEAKRKEAKYVGYENSPYDALMDDYEDGLTSASVSETFDDLKAFLIPFVDQIKNSKVKIKKDFLTRKFPIPKQFEFSRIVVEKIGFDPKRGRIDKSVHPFCESTHSTDVRLTTRFDEKDFINQALMSLIHEAGHGIYEQGLLEEYFGTPLGSAASMGVHESQSRLWENQVGRSRDFWHYFFPILKNTFPVRMEGIFPDEFYRALNYVESGLIRVDADEVTYNLHVILRFEIEKDLIEGNLEVAELPRVWNEKMEEYFGLKVPNDAQGVLQDIHWSGGSFGYFPTYTLGNIYAAQLFFAAKKQISDLPLKIAGGEFLSLRDWLKENIHIHGRRYSPEELIVKATGDKPLPVYLIDYLEKKYSEIYNL